MPSVSSAWACFPGTRDGNLAQGLAATLFEMVKTCNWAIDIHTPTPGGRYVSIAILPHRSLGESHARAEEMAHSSAYRHPSWWSPQCA